MSNLSGSSPSDSPQGTSDASTTGVVGECAATTGEGSPDTCCSSDAATDISNDESSPQTALDKRWPACFALLTAGFTPATTARRTAHISLKRAFLFLILSGLLTAAVIVIAVAGDSVSYIRTLASVFSSLEDMFGDLTTELRQQPGEILLLFAGVTLMIAVDLALLAIVVMSWGAKDESLRATYRNTLRAVLIWTAMAPMVAMVIGGTVVAIEWGERSWRRVDGSQLERPEYPTPPAGVRRNTAEWKEFDEAAQSWYPTLLEYQTTRRREQPWYVADPEIVIVNTVFLCVAWLIWALLRAVGARRDPPAIVRPPTCEACGYNLTTMSMEHRCPECGLIVAESLSANIRPGAPWVMRFQVGRVLAWWHSATAAIFTPTKLGRRIRLHAPGTDHRGYIAMHLPILFLTGASVVPIMYFLIEGELIFSEEPEAGFIATPVVGCLCCFGAVGLSVLVASIIGTILSWREKRNLLPGAMQISAYLFPLLVVWCVFGGVLGITVEWLEQSGITTSVQETIGVPRGAVATLLWGIPNASIGIWYLVLVTRGTTATRYANR